MVTQTLASLTSEPVLFVPPWSPHLQPTHCFSNANGMERFAQETSWETNGSWKLHGQHCVWCILPGTVSTLSRPFSDYSGNVTGEQSGTSLTIDALLATCQVSSLDCLLR